MTESNEKPIPLSQQPTYQSAISKVIEISRVLSETTAQLQRCRANFFAVQNIDSPAINAIDRALALARGGSLSENPLPATATTEIKRLEEEEQALKIGLAQANDEARLIARGLGKQAGKQANAAHQAAVKNILDRLNDLCAANKAEVKVRLDLEAIGYSEHGLIPMHFQCIGEVEDSMGSPAYYYAREANSYIG